jgi:hypothetical protein
MDKSLRPPRFDARQAMDPHDWPGWWLSEHTNAWERTKDALRRDWLATMSDFDAAASRQLARDIRGGSGFGGAPSMAFFEGPTTPPPMVFELAEPALRYGFAAASHYRVHVGWDDALEAVLRNEWTQRPDARPWSVVVDDVRRGWESARGRSEDDTDPGVDALPALPRPHVCVVRTRSRRRRYRACPVRRRRTPRPGRGATDPRATPAAGSPVT